MFSYHIGLEDIFLKRKWKDLYTVVGREQKESDGKDSWERDSWEGNDWWSHVDEEMGRDNLGGRDGVHLRKIPGTFPEKEVGKGKLKIQK